MGFNCAERGSCAIRIFLIPFPTVVLYIAPRITKFLQNDVSSVWSNQIIINMWTGTISAIGKDSFWYPFTTWHLQAKSFFLKFVQLITKLL